MKQINRTEFVRVVKDKNYTVLNNEFLRRKDLSWKSKGILAYVLSLPDDWNINIEEVMKHATEGKSAFRSGWNELRDTGYVKRQPVKDKETKKILYWETVVFENVGVTANEPHTDYPPSGKPLDGKPDTGKSNTTKYLKELSTNKQSTKEHSSAKLTEDFDKLWNLYPNKQGKKKAKSSYDRAIKSGTTNKEIQDGIKSYKNHLKQNDWLKPAHGATWFNNERWEDEYTIESQTKPSGNNYIEDWSEFENMLE